ncbi:hypothetical protein C8R43DRAFT_1197898, partial [Mycena crocata]
PVLSLPNEITSEIFLHSIPAYPIHLPSGDTLSPTTLTHICRTWSNVALATPALWRAISHTFIDLNSDERNNELLLQWIERSQSLPLSIGMFFEDGKIPWGKCIETLNSHRARWEYLTVAWISEPEVVLSLLCAPMPSLRSIDLSFDASFGPSFTLADAPLLRSASLRYFPGAVVLPWPQLTHLSLMSVYPHECTSILQQTTALLHCELDLLWPTQAIHNFTPQPDVHLPLLQSLIFYQRSQNVPNYFRTLVVPALQTLQVSEAFLGKNPILALKSFIATSGCSLAELCI